jgi:hypothetical protein
VDDEGAETTDVGLDVSFSGESAETVEQNVLHIYMSAALRLEMLQRVVKPLWQLSKPFSTSCQDVQYMIKSRGWRFSEIIMNRIYRSRRGTKLGPQFMFFLFCTWIDRQIHPYNN